MRKITFPALLVVIILSTCQKDSEPEDPADNSTVYLAEATIDAAGGTLQHADFEMVIPAGAFSNSFTLKLARDETVQPMDTEQSGPVFIVEGFPLDLSKSLTVKIRIINGAKEDLFAVIGEENFTQSADTVQTSYRSLPAVVESGWASFELPALAKGKKSSGASDTFPLKFTLFGGYQVFGEGTHFLVHTPPSLFLEAEALHGYLEEAYERLQEAPFNFSYENRTSWPVTVTIKRLPAGLLGAYSNSKWGDNHGYLEFNRTEMEDPAELQITAGHEYFHLVQSLYDPRSAYYKAISRPAWHWMNEAFAVWSEAFFPENPNYVSAIREHTQWDPFDGPIAGAATEPGLHGYGMAALIQYLHTVFPAADKSYHLVYEQISDGKGAADALRIIQDENGGNIWQDYHTFLSDYTAGLVYPDLTVDILKDNVSDVFWIQEEEDTLVQFNNVYPDNSARLFEVLLEFPNMKKGTSIELLPQNPNTGVSLFKYKGQEVVRLLDVIPGVLYNYPGLKTLMDEGWNLLVLVVNKHFEPPYTGSGYRTIKIRIKPGEVTLPPHVDYVFTFSGNFQWSGDTSVFHEGNGFIQTGFIHNGSVISEDNWYEAWWDTIDIDGWHRKGNLLAQFDPENQQIAWIDVKDMLNTGTVKDTISFRVEAIPAVTWEEDYLYFELMGTNIVNHIPYVYTRRFAYGNTLTQLSYDCQLNCSFSMTLKKYQ